MDGGRLDGDTRQASGDSLTALETLDHDELLRTRWFCGIAIGIAIAAAAAILQLGGDPVAAKTVLVALAVAVCAIGYLLARTRDLATFKGSGTGVAWFVTTVCVTTTVPFFGPFSPVPLILVLGIYVTALGRNDVLAYAIFIAFAGTQAVASIVVIAEPRLDPGLVHAPSLGTADKLVMQGLVLVVLLATFVTARVSRTASLRALDRMREAVRIAAHRQALLLEARAELEHARRPGVGRFTDQRLNGYELGIVIGRGAMGEIYAATAPDGTDVAVKLLSQTALSDGRLVTRFERELETARRVVSPNVVRVLEVGMSPVPYLVMERLTGASLAERLRRRPVLDPVEVVELLRQLAHGVTAAAAAGIVHRDLKPHNIFEDRGTWKILDFGIARAADAGDTLTAGNAVGTPAYMAPEQALGNAVDHCTDLYALAAIAYRCLTGRPPFAAGNAAQTLYQVVNLRPPRPSAIASHLSPSYDLVLAIGMAYKPSCRFANANDLADAVAAAFANAVPPDLVTRARELLPTAWSTRHERTLRS
jgi:eukaryotic-like serine/threonine-protein kinase